MRIVTVTGNHPRHAYLVHKVAASGHLAGTIIEQRESFVPQPPDGLSHRLSALFTLHFNRRAEAEERFFGGTALKPIVGLPAHTVDPDNLNGADTLAFLDELAPDLILSYGCHKLAEPVLARARRYAWNVHGGLSPWYRGVATHFWPSYMLEPQMTGMTLHRTTDQLDGGAIIHQTGIDLVRGDGLHDLAARAVQGFADGLPDLLKHVAGAREPVTGTPQATAGRLWTVEMWRPEHLVVVYDHYEDRIVDRVLDGELVGREPKLVTVMPGGPTEG